MADDIDTLVSESKCFDCVIEQGMFWPVAIYILQQTLDGQAVSDDPSTLVNAARCYDCVIPPGMTPAVMLKELVDLNASIISGGGGGGGTAQMYEYTGTDPTSDGIVPANQNLPAMAYKRDGSSATYTWNTVTHVWA